MKIQVAVIVVAFAASGFVLYNGLKGSSPSPSSPLSPQAGVMPAAGGALGATTTATSNQALLPYGPDLQSTLNSLLSSMQQQDFKFGIMQYPKLDPQNDVGVPVQQIFHQATSTQ